MRKSVKRAQGGNIAAAERGNVAAAERGNVMVIILIAVVLFGALGYSIKRSSAPSSAIRTSQQANIAADRIIQFGNAVEATVNDLMGQGVMIHQLDFGSTVFRQWQASPGAWPDNPNCTSNACRVFASKGGTLREVIFHPEATTKFLAPYSSGRPYPGHPTFFRTNVVNVGGATSNELTMMVVSLSNEVCEAIAYKLGNPGAWTGGTEDFGSWGIPAMNTAGTDNYWSFDAPMAFPDPFGDESLSMAGKTKGCTKFQSLQNTYVHVLVAR